MEKFHQQSFDWLSWRNGDLYSMLKVSNRTRDIIDNKLLIRDKAVGYCESDDIPCRPKIGYVAVMFDGEWWTHFTKEEFVGCFPEIEI